MLSETFKAGDVVQLKSGGPKMTISWVEEEKSWCIWFVDQKHQGEEFNIATLVKVKSE